MGFDRRRTERLVVVLNGRPTEPADSKATVDAIARVRNTPPDALANAIGTNLKALLRFGEIV